MQSDYFTNLSYLDIFTSLIKFLEAAIFLPLSIQLKILRNYPLWARSGRQGHKGSSGLNRPRRHWGSGQWEDRQGFGSATALPLNPVPDTDHVHRV